MCILSCLYVCALYILHYAILVSVFICVHIYTISSFAHLTRMVIFHEDAHRPKNLSLFAISCEHFCGPKKQHYEEIWHPLFCFMLGQYFRTIFVLQGVRKKCKKRYLLKSQLRHNTSIKITRLPLKRGPRNITFFNFKDN